MISTDEFKKSLGKFASGVTVITYKEKSSYSGITVSSFSSLSLDPPLVLFSINKSYNSHDRLTESKFFAIHILSNEQENLSNSFASSKVNKNDLILSLNPSFKEEIPILPSSLSVLLCENYKIYDGGDHSIFLGKVVYTESDDSREPLLYYNKGYRSLSK